MKLCLIVLILKMTCASFQEYMLNSIIKLINCVDINGELSNLSKGYA